MRFRVFAPGRISAVLLAGVLLPCAARCGAPSPERASTSQAQADDAETRFLEETGLPPEPSTILLLEPEFAAPEQTEVRGDPDSLLDLAGNVLGSSEPDSRQASWNSLSGWSIGPGQQPQGGGITTSQRPYEWQMLPQGLMYHAYVAGEKEPRIGLSILNDPHLGTIWEATLGGRVGIIRHGTRGAINPEGWQIDLEGAALARVDQGAPSTPLLGTDYRVGMQWTRRKNGTAIKAGYYHISSHVGDEFLLNNPGFDRLNYVRDSLVFGVTRDLSPNWQGYGEIGYALGLGGGSQPLEFQFGLQYDQSDRVNMQGAPFAAVNVHLRQEVNFGGGVNVRAGWRWRGAESGHVLRVGLQYYNGKSIQYSFFNQSEQFIGGGVWFDY